MLRMVTAALMCATAAACGGTTATAPPPATTTPPLAARPPDPATIAANELGQIPILMYHRIETDPGSEYDETPQQFTAELDRLYTEGYRPITIATFLSGSIDLPAGTHPVILTFDDSTRPQLTLTASGDPTPDCAVGLLEQFHSRHPDFAATATFYVNNDPFGADPRTLPWLARHGYDLGAHTATHANLARLPATDVQRELVQNIRAITAATPGTPLRSMALPWASIPPTAPSPPPAPGTAPRTTSPRSFWSEQIPPPPPSPPTWNRPPSPNPLRPHPDPLRVHLLARLARRQPHRPLHLRRRPHPPLLPPLPHRPTVPTLDLHRPALLTATPRAA